MKYLLFFSFLISNLVFSNPNLPGGTGSNKDFSRNAFSHIFNGVSRVKKLEFGVGNSFFRLGWVVSPASAVGRDGLGPTYNAISCSSCHMLDGRGEAYRDDESTGVSLLLKISVWNDYLKEFTASSKYGEQVNNFAIPGVKPEANLNSSFMMSDFIYPDGSRTELRKPIIKLTDWAYGAPHSRYMTSTRIAPQLIGLGLLEAIRATDIVNIADPDDLNRDGISGRVHFVDNKITNEISIGRFGWKADQPSLLFQNAGAAFNDMGLTSSLFQKENCPVVQIDCLNSFKSEDFDVSDKVLDRITTYTQLLAVPVKRELDTGHKGEALFIKAKCLSCHRAHYKTGEHKLSALSDQDIYPYTDLLLHDMGKELADNRSDKETTSTEWRTSPLWGIGLLGVVNGKQELLHDGRARNIEEAILWHGGEASQSKRVFINMSKIQRSYLVDFVNSL